MYAFLGFLFAFILSTHVLNRLNSRSFCSNIYFMSNIDIRPLLGSKISFLYILSAMVIDKLESNMGGEDMYTLFNN